MPGWTSSGLSRLSRMAGGVGKGLLTFDEPERPGLFRRRELEAVGDAPRGRRADAVQQRGEGEGERNPFRPGRRAFEPFHDAHDMVPPRPLGRQELGQEGRDQVELAEQPEAPARFGWTSSFRSSSAIRSAETTVTAGAVALRRGERFGLHVEPEPGGDAHGPQHAELVLVEPRGGVADGPQDAWPPGRAGRRRSRAARRSIGSRNMPLIVKSRRWASSSGVENVTDSGRRPSTYWPSERKVATSTVRCRPPASRGPTTSITPKLAPTPTERRNSRRTSSGRASVATS